MNKWIRIILAIVAGEIALVLLTFVAQEVVFDGIRFQTSSWGVLVFGGILTVLAAVLAGVVARIVSKNFYPIVPTIISALILLESTWLMLEKITGDPLWFDVLAALSLVFGIWLGYQYGQIFHKRNTITNPIKA